MPCGALVGGDVRVGVERHAHPAYFDLWLTRIRANACRPWFQREVESEPGSGERMNPERRKNKTVARLRLWALLAWTLPPLVAGLLLYLFGVYLVGLIP